jgi:hypothetical protein
MPINVLFFFVPFFIFFSFVSQDFYFVSRLFEHQKQVSFASLRTTDEGEEERLQDARVGRKILCLLSRSGKCENPLLAVSTEPDRAPISYIANNICFRLDAI